MRRRDALEQKKTALTRTNAADRLFLDGLRGQLGALRTAVEPLRMKLSSGNVPAICATVFSPTSSGTVALRRFPAAAVASQPAGHRALARRRRRRAPGVLKRLENENGRVVRDVAARTWPRRHGCRHQHALDGPDEKTTRWKIRTSVRKQRAFARRRRGGDGREMPKKTNNAHRRKIRDDRVDAVPAPGAHDSHAGRCVRLGADEYGGSITFRRWRRPRACGHCGGSRFSSHVRGTLLVDLFPGTTCSARRR